MTGSPTPLIAGNWKMHGSNAFASDLAGTLADRMTGTGDAGFEMLLCPPALLLGTVRTAVGTSGIAVGGQDCHTAEQGAHTGDIAAAMLADAGCGYVIVGHSERRADHGEDDALVRAKASAAQVAGLVPVVCIGETLDQRDAGAAVDVVTEQLRGSVPDGSSAATLVVAYEPVWAIGTGRTPTPADIAEVHDAIRAVLSDIAKDGDGVRILYGGSVKPENAAEILAIDNVNGALVGGASLKADDFWGIAQSA
ncbi:MAG: triose-phosphate isomerase [Alphaproteobacteria bacterium]